MISRYALIIPAALSLSAPLQADAASDIAELKKLIMAQAAEIAALKDRLSDVENIKTTAPVVVSGEKRVVTTPALAPKMAPVASSEKKGFTIKPRGRLQYDTVFYDEDEGGRSYDNGSNFRRARLGVQGTLAGGFEYQLEADFSAGDKVKLDDTFIRYRIDPKTAITFGFHKVYHTLESATSDQDVSFMERHMVSNIFEIGAGGKMGVSILSGGENWSGQFGVFAGSANSGDGDKDGWGVNARATWAPLLEEGKLVHLGLAAYYRDEDDDMLSMGDRPEIRHDSFKPFDSGTFAADNYRFGNAEFAAALGSLTAQFEYSVMDTQSILGDRSFDGYSGQVSYFLTGESKPYSAHKGAFGKLKPLKPLGAGGFGALELAARYSRVDLADLGQGSYGDNLTLGVTWYPTDMVRFMLNAVDFRAHGAVDESGRAYGVRAHVRW